MGYTEITNITIEIILLILACLNLHRLGKLDRPKHPEVMQQQQPPRERKFLVPGRGYFTEAPKKRPMKWTSESEQWAREQDEKRNHT